jgi:glycerol-3-phosphate acyltransferase PlsY
MHWLLVIVGYLCGSIPFGVMVTALFAKKDVRAEGSGNIGATNVTRVAGKKLGLVVLLLDVAKGALPVWVSTVISPENARLHVAVAAMAFLGHVFPVWLQFKGGKGVATAMGVLLVLLPVPALMGLLAWVMLFVLTRISSVGSLGAALVALGATWFGDGPRLYAVLMSALFVSLVYTHRSNIGRLFQRTERRF